MRKSSSLAKSMMSMSSDQDESHGLPMAMLMSVIDSIVSATSTMWPVFFQILPMRFNASMQF